ncbi:MAG TPA: glycine zipper domain-containing protein [Pirellulaceae bacterium]|nr:glycine zipper domain-containing protein [Pirellulaceae bacterium]
MHCRVCLILFLFNGLAFSAGCQSMNYAQRGGVLGGLAGAGIGAAAGESGGDAVPGALIGGAVGALTGSVIGDGIDADMARKAEIEARIGRQLAGAVTSEDAIAMTRAGLSDDVVISHIRAHGVARPLEVNDLIYLRNQGVSDAVIKALQTSPGPVAVVRGPPGPPPVVVHEYYDPWWGPPPRWYHRHHHPPGFSWGIHLHH